MQNKSKYQQAASESYCQPKHVNKGNELVLCQIAKSDFKIVPDHNDEFLFLNSVGWI
jgi:hypothetical protein